MEQASKTIVSSCCTAEVQVETYNGNNKYNVCSMCGRAFCEVKTIVAAGSVHPEIARLERELTEDDKKKYAPSKYNNPFGNGTEVYSISLRGQDGKVIKVDPCVITELGPVIFDVNYIPKRDSYTLVGKLSSARMSCDLASDFVFDNPECVRLAQMVMAKKLFTECSQSGLGPSPTGTAFVMTTGDGEDYVTLAEPPKREPFWKRGTGGKDYKTSSKSSTYC